MFREQKSGQLIFSPSDLCKYWESEFASWMDRYDLEHPGTLTPNADDALSKVLQQKGYDHEESTILTLEAQGRSVFRIDDSQQKSKAEADTLAAIERGEDVIFQARLGLAPFAGVADFLVKTPGRSKLGDYHYEVWDTKLAKKLKPYFALQLCAYSEMLEAVQGTKPANVAIVLGNGMHKQLKLDDFYFYYLAIKNKFTAFHHSFDPTKRPDPEKYRSFGKWEDEAKKILVEQDALSQVATLTSVQARNLKAAGIKTMAELAACKLEKIPKMGAHILSSLRIQAQLQIESRGKERPAYALRNDNPNTGLYCLPAESIEDVYFDIEGFPLVDGGLEYLWGNAYLENGQKSFRDFWAHNSEEEKSTFEEFIDWVYARWRKDPNMHVYHYANYEIAVIRRLMGRYGTREHEVDQLLRHEVFVDLYNVVRQGLYVGEPRYSIKNIEHLYRGKREGAVTDGGASVEFYESWRSNPDGKTWEDSKILKDIRDYNIDDCYSTLELTNWLRIEQKKNGIPPKPTKIVADPAENANITNIRDLQAKLLEKAPSHPEALILSQLIDFYRREAKPKWWKFFDRQGSLPEDLFEDADCLSGLIAYDEAEPHRGKQLRRVYTFDPEQDCKLSIGAKCVHHGNSELAVKVEDIDFDGGHIALIGSPEALPETLSLIPKDEFAHDILAKSVAAYCQRWLTSPDESSAVSDFLRRQPPRFKNRTQDQNTSVLAANSDLPKSAVDAVLDMNHTFLCIQGPPGTGKTYTAEHIIAALVKNGMRIGIASNSHKAVNNLLIRGAQCSAKQGIIGQFVKVCPDDEPELTETGLISTAKTARNLKITNSLSVIGGTAWTFASDVLENNIDYLFIDEAGQVSIANLIAMARSAKNVVVMGDQMQLAQPVQGTHPGDSGKSILDYYMADHATVPETHGIFLPVTYRMHPEICSFISSAVYEGRLKSAQNCENQQIDVSSSKYFKSGSGIHYISCEHEGNSQASDEEVAVIQKLFKDLLGRTYTDKTNQMQNIKPSDILVVAPYNLQVRKLQEALGDDARVGSVDKFQGQEAPIVILSMCASDASSGRGIDFLFNKNRLNVAISRAQALAVVVGHSQLATTFTTNIEKIKMINMFARLVR
jgi:predicted RecB family nuclease